MTMPQFLARALPIDRASPVQRQFGIAGDSALRLPTEQLEAL